ncbi:MAG: alanine--tRNA ligase-related protein, partial [Patescibacteria group bacterium]
MKADELRKKYLDYFEMKGHTIVPSSSLIPENDPTTLFTSSGMQPMIPYLFGEPHQSGKRVADSQRCFRTNDIDEVGDSRHTTFFEMLGNWSFGDYFKKEQIPWMFDFLVHELSLDPNRIYITCFNGKKEENIPQDTEAAEIWKHLFEQEGVEAEIGKRISYYGEDKNWWSRSGVTANMPVGEPGGPDSEIFWDFDPKEGLKLHENSMFHNEACHVNCDCGRYFEIGNNVFMQYKKTPDGFEPLPAKNIDFGGGLERLLSAVIDSPDIFQIDIFNEAKKQLELLSNTTYGAEPKQTRAFRVILDHLRAATFLIADGAVPSNKDQGYFTRRLCRRAVRYGRSLGITELFCSIIGSTYVDHYQEAFPWLKQEKEKILQELSNEENKFTKTLEKGLKEFNKYYNSKGQLTGQDAFI